MNKTTEDIHKNGVALWRLMNTGATEVVPYLRDMRGRATHPRPGDLVIEVTQWSSRFDPDRVGILVRHEGESPDDRWIVEPYDRPGVEQAWQNAVFIALPARGEGWPA